MNETLIDTIAQTYGYSYVDEQSVDALLAANDEVVLFFTDDPTKNLESNDVAVILPEINKSFNRRFAVGIVKRSAEKALNKRFHFKTWPTLVFVQNGEHMGSISRVQDWDYYVEKVHAILAGNEKPMKEVGIDIQTN